MPRVDSKAILLGVVVDLGGALLLGFGFVLVYAGILLNQGIPKTELVQHTRADHSFYSAAIIFRLLSLGTGAFLAARLARTAEYTHATLVWLLALVIGFLPRFVPHAPPVPSWYLHTLYACEFPIALAGGLVAKRLKATQVSRGAA